MYKVQTKFALYTQNEVHSYSVTIADTDSDNYTIITAVLDGNHAETHEEKLIELVLEAFYKRTYHDRYEKEELQKLKEINKQQQEQLAKSDALLQQTNNAMLELTEQVYANDEKLTFLYNHLKLEYKEEVEEEVTTKQKKKKEETAETTETDEATPENEK